MHGDGAATGIWTALLALSLVVPGIIYASVSKAQPAQSGYTCPLTGEELPCPKCCPLDAKR